MFIIIKQVDAAYTVVTEMNNLTKHSQYVDEKFDLI